jgi:diguanylate cyclase (GGDEF)-like protein
MALRMGGPSPLGKPARSTRVKIAGGMLLAGGALGLLGVLLPPAADGSEGVIAACAVGSLVLGAGLVITRRKLPEWALGVIAAASSLTITLATVEGGAGLGTEDNEMLYIWIALYSFYFFSFPHALLQTAVLGSAYAWLLSGDAVAFGDAATRWMVTMTTLLIGGLIVSRLRLSVRRLVAELTERARIDGLTGLLNREGLEQRAVVELARARRDGTPLVVMVADLDNFKAINDTLGHAAGDEALRHVAAAMETQTRAVDAVARIGGDEFTLLLPAIGEAAAAEIGERLRAATRVAGEELGVDLAVSVGFAVGTEGIESLEYLWQAADRAMYAAKRDGGDAVEAMPQQRIRVTATGPGTAAPTMTACPPAAS